MANEEIENNEDVEENAPIIVDMTNQTFEGTKSQDSKKNTTMKGTPNKVTKKSKFSVQLLVLFMILFCILSLFGGEAWGNWYTTTQQTERADGTIFSSGQANYGINAVFILGEINGESVDENETLEMNYGDLSGSIGTECNCDKIENVMFIVKMLVYINLIIGIGIIYFIRYQRFNRDMIIKLLFAIVITTLIAAIYFAAALPNAINEDQGGQSIYLIQEKEPSFISMYSDTPGTARELNDFFPVTIKAQWYPDLGFLYLITNILCCFLSLGIVKYDFSKIFGSLED